MSVFPVISADTATFFEKEGLLSPVLGNKRKISSSILSSSRPSSSKNSTSSTFTAASIHEAADGIEIPEFLDSIEALEFIGLRRDAAEDIYGRYLSAPDDQPDDLLDFALAFVEHHPVDDATSASDDWSACLKALCINKQLSKAIMMDHFASIRFTASCKFWVLEALTCTYNSLSDLYSHLQETQLRMIETAALSSESPSPGPENAPVSLPGYHMLWHATSATKARLFYEPPNIHFGAIAIWPNDFSGRATVGYFTPQKAIADRFAAWLKIKAPITAIAVIQVAVPDALIDALDVHCLWGEERWRPADEWKRLVWDSRAGRRSGRVIEHLRKKDVLVGHMPSGKECKFGQVRDPAEIRDTDVLEIEEDGRLVRGVQWAFVSGKAERGFREQCAGKVWLLPMGTLKVPKEVGV